MKRIRLQMADAVRTGPRATVLCLHGTIVVVLLPETQVLNLSIIQSPLCGHIQLAYALADGRVLVPAWYLQ